MRCFEGSLSKSSQHSSVCYYSTLRDVLKRKIQISPHWYPRHIVHNRGSTIGVGLAAAAKTLRRQPCKIRQLTDIAMLYTYLSGCSTISYGCIDGRLTVNRTVRHETHVHSSPGNPGIHFVSLSPLTLCRTHRFVVLAMLFLAPPSFTSSTGPAFCVRYSTHSPSASRQKGTTTIKQWWSTTFLTAFLLAFLQP